MSQGLDAGRRAARPAAAGGRLRGHPDRRAGRQRPHLGRTDGAEDGVDRRRRGRRHGHHRGRQRDPVGPRGVLRRAQRHAGDRLPARDRTPLTESTSFTGLTIDNPDDVDWYRFSRGRSPGGNARLTLSTASDLDGLVLALFEVTGTAATARRSRRSEQRPAATRPRPHRPRHLARHDRYGVRAARGAGPGPRHRPDDPQPPSDVDMFKIRRSTATA